MEPIRESGVEHQNSVLRSESSRPSLDARSSDSTESENIRFLRRYFRHSSLEDDVEDGAENSSASKSRRVRSLYGESPSYFFGPKASVRRTPEAVMTIPDPGLQRLTWSKPPLSVLVIKKIHVCSVLSPFCDLLNWLVQDQKMSVWVEDKSLADCDYRDNQLLMETQKSLNVFREGEMNVTIQITTLVALPGKEDLTNKIDLIICMGGDGTLLYVSSLFQQSVPPVVAFHFGSLGFLSSFPFNITTFREQLTDIFRGNAALTLRNRLRCIVTKSDGPNSEVINNHIAPKDEKNLVLNEVVVDRGQYPYLCNLDLFIDNRYVTTVQGDGLIISTPTGSTAYSAAAGASMIHPSVPAILITPVCPHSLSFRPIVVPAGVEVKITLSSEARSNAWVSFDGRNRKEMGSNDILLIRTSIYPIPSICSQDPISDWFDSLSSCLHWNSRKVQERFSISENANIINGQPSNT